MVLKDRRGREFGTNVDSWEYVPTNLNIFLEPVNPGISKNGRVIYQVPPDAWGFTLRLDDVEFWEEESAVFDLSGMTRVPTLTIRQRVGPRESKATGPRSSMKYAFSQKPWNKWLPQPIVPTNLPRALPPESTMPHDNRRP